MSLDQLHGLLQEGQPALGSASKAEPWQRSLPRSDVGRQRRVFPGKIDEDSHGLLGEVEKVEEIMRIDSQPDSMDAEEPEDEDDSRDAELVEYLLDANDSSEQKELQDELRT